MKMFSIKPLKGWLTGHLDLCNQYYNKPAINEIIIRNTNPLVKVSLPWSCGYTNMKYVHLSITIISFLIYTKLGFWPRIMLSPTHGTAGTFISNLITLKWENEGCLFRINNALWFTCFSPYWKSIPNQNQIILSYKLSCHHLNHHGTIFCKLRF